ncbi:MAG: septum formation initiator family protein [Prevotellaceae bacterium]|jgi:cell division protein FtsB|nr:septum formation initiator family protein [Prevotellaceae bacterium]
MKLTIPLSQNKKLHRALRVVRNKYVLVTLVFAVWVSFFDGNSLLERAAVARKTARLEREAVYFDRVVKENKQRLHELKTDNDNLEKFAREQYLMKRDNEDVFIVISD